MIECQDEERLIPDTERSGDNGILSGRQILLHHGPQEWVLAGEDVRGVLPVHSIHCGKHGHVRVSQNGLYNAPATFQRLMQNCLEELNLQFTLIYLDNVIIYSRMQEYHLTHLQAVLDHFAHHGLKLKPSKCHFFKENITYLGHEISAKGMLPGQEGIQKIANMGPPPTTITGIRKFVGAVGYFHHFIKNFSRITRPLDDLTSCENSKLKNHPVTFQTLKKKCMTAPVLAFADLEKPFVLETNASGIGLGAVLLQEQEDGKLHPLAYASRALHESQKNYHSSKLEFLALKWAIMEQFREYLMYKPFMVRTDNNPLTYIMMMPNLDAMGHRWVNTLAGFHFKIEYLKGTDNKVADVLSCVETRLDDATTKELLVDCPNTVLKGTGYANTNEDPEAWTKVQKEAFNEVIERANFQHIPHAETDNPMLIAKHEEVEKENAALVAQLVATRHIKHNLVITDWKALQEANPILRHVLKWVCMMGELKLTRMPGMLTAAPWRSTSRLSSTRLMLRLTAIGRRTLSSRMTYCSSGIQLKIAQRVCCCSSYQ